MKKMLKTRINYKFVGGDYSSQEPRLAAHYAQDEAMIKAFAEEKDLYAVIAQSMYGNKYEDNLEFYPEGTELEVEGKRIICGHHTHQNKAGKDRRTQAKSVLLGIMYGRGAASVGGQIGKTKEEAQLIIDKFYLAFPKVKAWIDETIRKARITGYVEDIAGRRRRLPDLLLPEYEITNLSNKEEDLFNPFLECEARKIEDKLIVKYNKLLKAAKDYRAYNKIKMDALKDQININSNQEKISQAERQAVNSRVQGGAATLTKWALLNIYNDKQLKELGFKTVVTVHDEIMGECPEVNEKEVAKRLAEVMIESAKPLTTVPMKVDTYNVKCWYLDEFFSLVESEFKQLITTLSEKEAFEQLNKIRTESTRAQLYEIISPLLADPNIISI